MDIDEARALLETVIKGKLAGEEIIKAIEVMLRSYSAILNNLVMLENKFDGSAEEKVEDLTYNVNKLAQETDKLKEELKARYQKGYQDGFKQAKFDCEMDKLDGR